MTSQQAKQYSPLALAFMGDVVYEQLVREKLILEANRPAKKLHDLTIKKVCAEYQADAVKELIESDFLTEDEVDIFKRGRNSGGISAPKHSTVAQYRAATGLESLFGYLHLTQQNDRISEIFEHIWKKEAD